MKIFTKTLIASSITLALFGLHGCGGSSDQDNSSTNANIQMSGAIVDDYVAYSRIYVDVNNNGKFDSNFEPYATTDANGYFSHSLSGEDYCSNPKAYEYKYCLTVDSSQTLNAVIRTDSGRDILTAQIYNATMSLLTNGNTTGLTVTSLSSLDQTFNEIAADLEGEQLAQYSAFVQSLFPSATPSSARSTREITTENINGTDPFDAATSNPVFQLAFHLNKLTEAVATDFFDRNTGKTFLTEDRNGETIKEQDYTQSIYKAFIRTLDFTSTTPLATFSNNINAIYADILADMKVKTNNTTLISPTTTNSPVIQLNSFLLTSLKANEIAGTTFTPTQKRQNSFSAELATQGVKKIIKNETTETVDNILTKSNQATTVGFDYTQNDFESVLENVQDTQVATTDAITAEIVPFTNLVQNTFTTKGLKTGETGDTQFEIFFEKNNVNTAEEVAGDIIICQKDPEDAAVTLKGSWQWLNSKSYIIYADYLGVSFTIKQLDPTVTQCKAANNGTAPGACVVISYPDFNNAGEYLTQVAVDSTNWNDPAQVNNSQLLFDKDNGSQLGCELP